MDKSVNNWTGFYDIAWFAHAELLKSHRRFREETGDHKWSARNQMWMQAMTAIVFSVIACEGFLNYRAEIVLRKDPAAWKAFEGKQIPEKFTTLYQNMQGGSLSSKDPGMGWLRNAVRMRNSIVHQKSENTRAKGRIEKKWIEWSNVSGKAAYWVMTTMPTKGRDCEFIELIRSWHH